MVALVSLPTSRVADSPRVGRKGVLLMSMAVLGTSTLCFGFIRSFAQAMVLRIIEGTFSGGTLVVRTMIPEIVPGKRHRVKAFLLLPLAFNIGALAGPPLAGLLVAYAQSHATTNDFLGRWTYAPPMLMASGIIYGAFLAVFFLLEETLPALRDQPDIGIRIKKAVVRLWRRYRSRGEFKFGYEPANTRDSEDTQDSDPLLSPQADDEAQRSKREPMPAPAGSKLPLRKALTANVLLAASCQAMLDGLTAGYNTLWPLFLSDPPASAVVKGEENSSSPLRFSGGAGLQPYQIALTLTILAVTALPLQIWVYPRVSYKLRPIGTLRCFLWCPALAFALSPLIAVTVKFPILMWLVIAVVQLLMVLTSAMVVPSATLMTNNSAPSPAALAATHGLAMTLSAVARTIGPFAVGYVYAASQASRNGGLAWWLMAGTATCICIISWFVKDGTDQDATATPAGEMAVAHGANTKSVG
ncbi:putative membrane protein [Colletotrichum viniferum]|nr:putative membrane protein [Colletotrichum viniferum]